MGVRFSQHSQKSIPSRDLSTEIFAKSPRPESSMATKSAKSLQKEVFIANFSLVARTNKAKNDSGSERESKKIVCAFYDHPHRLHDDDDDDDTVSVNVDHLMGQRRLERR